MRSDEGFDCEYVEYREGVVGPDTEQKEKGNEKKRRKETNPSWVERWQNPLSFFKDLTRTP